MDLAIGLPALVLLVAGFIAVRRVIVRRRRSLEAYTRTRDERLRKSKPKDRRTTRAEMRANEDPTTVMGQMSSQPRDRRRDRR
ncbi:MAG: hypothetical protein IT519_06160 [Burkholderiales bacterium]|nr:hypothetical protein [Burkholderiales bacterium]